ncbi:MAG: hypothetical protein ACM3IJ_05965 [Candidatus Levyibacteriota bacterium]
MTIKERDMKGNWQQLHVPARGKSVTVYLSMEERVTLIRRGSVESLKYERNHQPLPGIVGARGWACVGTSTGEEINNPNAPWSDKIRYEK